MALCPWFFLNSGGNIGESRQITCSIPMITSSRPRRVLQYCLNISSRNEWRRLSSLRFQPAFLACLHGLSQPRKPLPSKGLHALATGISTP